MGGPVLAAQRGVSTTAKIKRFAVGAVHRTACIGVDIIISNFSAVCDTGKWPLILIIVVVILASLFAKFWGKKLYQFIEKNFLKISPKKKEKSWAARMSPEIFFLGRS